MIKTILFGILCCLLFSSCKNSSSEDTQNFISSIRANNGRMIEIPTHFPSEALKNSVRRETSIVGELMIDSFRVNLPVAFMHRSEVYYDDPSEVFDMIAIARIDSAIRYMRIKNNGDYRITFIRLEGIKLITETILKTDEVIETVQIIYDTDEETVNFFVSNKKIRLVSDQKLLAMALSNLFELHFPFLLIEKISS